VNRGKILVGEVFLFLSKGNHLANGRRSLRTAPTRKKEKNAALKNRLGGRSTTVARKKLFIGGRSRQTLQGSSSNGVQHGARGWERLPGPDDLLRRGKREKEKKGCGDWKRGFATKRESPRDRRELSILTSESKYAGLRNRSIIQCW